MRRTLLTLIFFLLLIGNAVGASGDTEIWFGPLQHETSVKYDELMNNPSQWTNARNNVDVLLITQDISNLHSDAYSKLSGIKLALEVFITESTRSPDKTISCNSDIQADHVITLIRTIRSKGGDVKYVNMVEPLFEMQKSPKIADYIITLGMSGDKPIAGDWDNDGIDTIGVFRPTQGKFYLRNTNSQGNADITATFGTNGDLPIAGDWNNDGIDSVGVFRPTNGMFYLRNTNSAGPADASFAFGTKGDLPIAGDIDGSKKSGNHYVIISVKEKDVISNDDDVSKEPLPNRIWFGLNGNITSNWITEYQDDESGTDPEYYIIAEFGNLNNANKKDTRTSTMKVKACNRIKDGDCDGVKNEIDECPSSDECAVVNSNGCEEDTGEAKCQAFWDCSMVAWSDCNENNQQKRDLCKSGSGDCCGTWPLANCACSFTGDQENFNSCKDYFTPLTEKSCFTEEAFPAFTLSNFIITILLISGFYALRKKRY